MRIKVNAFFLSLAFEGDDKKIGDDNEDERKRDGDRSLVQAAAAKRQRLTVFEVQRG